MADSKVLFVFGPISDTLTAALLNSFCSTCATLICFCAIGHTRILYKMQHLPFKEYLVTEANHSSLEFGYIMYTQFLTLIGDQTIPVLTFFFMITSFSMDSAVRQLQMQRSSWILHCLPSPALLCEM